MYNEYRKRLKPTASSDHRLVKVPEGGTEHGGRRAVPRERRQNLEQLLSQMNLFAIELNKEEGKGLGMVIVNGKVRGGDGAAMEGVFVEDIVPGSLAHKDGRIKPGDLLVEIDGQQMVGRSLEEATQKLRASTINIQLQIGRPDFDISDTGDDQDGEEPIYVNELADPAQKELFIKLEKAEIRIAELEGEKEKAEHSLKVLTEEAEEDKKEMQKQMEELRQEFERHNSESQQNMTNLTQALATITMDKGKNDKQLEQLRKQLKEGGGQEGEIVALREQLLEAQEAKKLVERSLQSSKTKDQEIVVLSEKVSELEARVSQHRRARDSAQNDVQQLKTRLSSALEKVSTLDTRNMGLSYQLKQLSAQRSQQASGKTAEVALSQRSQVLSSAQQELSQSRAEQERLSAQVNELSMALEREEARRAWLEESLQSQKNSEKSNTADLLKKLQLQAKQIAELKDELEKRMTPFPAIGKDLEEEDEEEIGPSIMEVLGDSERHLEKEAELVKAAPKLIHKTGQMEPTRQPHQQRLGASVLQNGVHLHESKPKPPKPYERPKPKVFEKPKPSISEKPESFQPKPLPENLSEPQSSTEQQGDEDISSATELDAVTAVQRLDSSTVLHKSEMGSHLKRKKPSREYIRSMGSMTDILEGLSMEDLTETDEIKESESERVPDGDRTPVEKPKVVSWKESTPNESIDVKRPKPMPRAAPRHKTPVPKPETSSTGMPEASKRPQATPRHKREHSGTQSQEPEIKSIPSHQKIPERPPRPGKSEADMTPSHKHTHGSRDSPVIDNKSRPSPRHKREPSDTQTQEKMSPKHEPSHSHNHEPESRQSPPHRVPDRPPKPGKIEEEFSDPKRMVGWEPVTPSPKQSKSQPPLSKHSPALQQKPVKEEPEDAGHMVEAPNHPRDIPPPRSVQKHIRQVSKGEEGEVRALEHQGSKMDELMGKDPSELSVKEKALLAQRMLEKQREYPPPSVPRKHYKPMGEQDQTITGFDFETSPVRQRAKSFDDLDSSPKRVKKILPGAINVFGSPMRLRSATVATDEPDARRSRESIEYSGEHDRYLELPMEPIPREDTDAHLPEVKVPPKRPPPPLIKKPSDEIPVKTSPAHQHYETSTSILDQLNPSEMDISIESPTDDLTPTNDSNPLLQAAVDDSPSPDPSNINYDNVLGWSPDHVAIWLTKVGLGQHQQIFQDKGIQGFMLFDLDGSRLKALGISSNNDRGVLKREVKVLRPFADKQKKAMDKKRKEDKKQGKKKK